MALLDENAKKLVDRYNNDPELGQYNDIAAEVYQRRRTIGDPLSPQFESVITRGLIGFDMGRTMEGGACAFAQRLRTCLDWVRANVSMSQLGSCRLSSTDLPQIKQTIVAAYDRLATVGVFHSAKQSHVGATKVLHWLFPDLFIMIDSNVAMAFREHSGVPFRKGTQPGYSVEKYFCCLGIAQGEIRYFGADRFRQLEPGTPEARVFDKVAFNIGRGTT